MNIKPLSFIEKVGNDAGSFTKERFSKQIDSALKQIKIGQTKINRYYDVPQTKKSIADIMQTQKILKQIPFTNNKTSKTNKQVPSTVRVLDNYMQRFGFLGLGQIYDKPGDKFVGRYIARNLKGQLQYQNVKFDKEFIFQTPDIGKNICNYANRAVMKWNQFVQSEGQLTQYLNKLDKTKDYNKYISQLAKLSCAGSIRYKILATLYYFYVKQNQNPLFFKIIDEQKIIEMLEQKGQLSDKWAQVLDFMKDKNQNFHKKMQKAVDQVANMFKVSLPIQIQKPVLQVLLDQKAYILMDMIDAPIKQLPKWVSAYQNNGNGGNPNNNNVFKIQQWDPQSIYFRPKNYISL